MYELVILQTIVLIFLFRRYMAGVDFSATQGLPIGIIFLKLLVANRPTFRKSRKLEPFLVVSFVHHAHKNLHSIFPLIVSSEMVIFSPMLTMKKKYLSMLVVARKEKRLVATRTI